MKFHNYIIKVVVFVSITTLYIMHKKLILLYVTTPIS